jgi:bZIP transcription factor
VWCWRSFGSASATARRVRGYDQQLQQLRRKRSLQMNRETARARRKRKKMLIDTLEQEVADLTKSNQQYQVTLGNLTMRVSQLDQPLFC